MPAFILEVFLLLGYIQKHNWIGGGGVRIMYFMLTGLIDFFGERHVLSPVKIGEVS